MTWYAMTAGFAALALVLWVQRRCGPRLAGLCMCLPLTSGPLALAVYVANGAEAARTVVSGSVDAIAGAALSLTALSAMRRWPVWVSAPATIALFVLVVAIKNNFASTPLQAVIATAVVIGLCAAFAHRFLREGALCAPPRTPSGWRTTYLMPFAVLALAFALAPMLPLAWSGLLASAPTLALAMLIPMRIGNPQGHGIAHAVQGGYAGMAAKLSFFLILMAAFDFEGHAWIVFALGALLCFAAGLALWRRSLRGGQPNAQPAMMIAPRFSVHTRAA